MLPDNLCDISPTSATADGAGTAASLNAASRTLVLVGRAGTDEYQELLGD